MKIEFKKSKKDNEFIMSIELSIIVITSND